MNAAGSMEPRRRLAILISHPIQHWVHLYRALAAEPGLDVRVFFASRMGLDSYFDPEMKTEIRWNMDLLSGYDHAFLPGAEQVTEFGFFKLNNRGLTAALRDFAPDAVFFSGYNTANSLRTLQWCRRNGVRSIMFGDCEPKSPRGWRKLALKRLALPFVLRRVDAFFTIGDENEAYYRSYGVPAKRLHRGAHPVDEASYGEILRNREQIRGAVRREWGIAREAVVLLYVGKFSDRKRPYDAIEAMGSPHLRGSSVHLLMAGSGELLDAMRSKAADLTNVTLAGFVNVDRLPSLYAAADILVHPSGADPHPFVCSEAALCGMPMILSDRVGAIGPTDVARPGENALVYPCGDVPALSEAIRTLAEDGHLRARMSAASAQIYREADIDCAVRGMRSAIGIG